MGFDIYPWKSGLIMPKSICMVKNSGFPDLKLCPLHILAILNKKKKLMSLIFVLSRLKNILSRLKNNCSSPW